jgi:two-component system phosphate regulon response regulator OmpR
MRPSPQVLIVDDDHEIRKLLARYLVQQGFRVQLAATVKEMKQQAAVHGIDLIVLDVMLPDGSGLDLCRDLRAARSDVPVILLTALKEDIDRIIGLEIGADDYLGKPFNPRELVARIRAVLRRRGDPPAGNGRLKTYRFADFTAAPHTRSVVGPDGGPIDLTGAEFDLLIVFLDRPGRVLSREQLLDLTRGRDVDALDRSIDVLVSRLRRKLGDQASGQLLKTVRNGGYQLATTVEVETGQS